MRWVPTCCAPSTTSSPRTGPTSARSAWSRGRYDEAELDNVYTGNDARARIVLAQLRDKVTDVGAMRALGFCVSIAHAEYMARVFNEAGIPALRSAGSTPGTDEALTDLRAGEVNILFAADLFNEGLDIPEVDTILFLRPTESATVSSSNSVEASTTRDKAVLTVLDFVGYHRKEFRFDLKLRAITGDTRAGIERQVREASRSCHPVAPIQMDRQAQALVLENIRSQIANRWQQIVAELRRHSEATSAASSRVGYRTSDILRREVIRGPCSGETQAPDAPGSELESGPAQARARVRPRR